MTNDELDRILSSKDDAILPSSGLMTSVMEAVRFEAATPPPISFPWRRALPGLAAAGSALAWLVVFLLDQLFQSSAALPVAVGLPAGWTPAVQMIGWLVLALLLSLISVKLSMELTSQ